MDDQRGRFYYPFPENKRVRMYVKEEAGTVWFRLWNQNDPELWEQHGWVPYGAVRQASKMYEGKRNFDPDKAYDINVARMILKNG